MRLSHKPFVMIALGGALGALSRFYLSVFIDIGALNFGQSFKTSSAIATSATSVTSGTSATLAASGTELLSHDFLLTPSIGLFFSLFPLAILLINMLGSLILGFFLAYMQYTEKNNIPLRNFFVIGFLGSLTTFSTFIIDSIELIIPFLMQSALLQKIFPHIVEISYSLGSFFPFYSKDLLLTHSLIFALGNIVLNLVLCIACVAMGHGFMRKRYSKR